jgi:hypothetical protein
MEVAEDVTAMYKNLHDTYFSQDFLDNKSGEELAKDLGKYNVGLVNKLKEFGITAYINPNTQEIVAQAPEGDRLVDPSFVKSMAKSRQEITGSVLGGLAGAEKGALLGARVAGKTGAIVGGVAGGLLGGYAGAGLGKGLDTLYNSVKLKEDLETKLVLKQMNAAGIDDAVMTVVGGAITKVMGSAIMKSYKFYKDGHTKGALKALKENLNISDEQAIEITEGFERSLGKPLTVKAGVFRQTERAMTPEEKQLTAIATTQRQAESEVAKAAAQNVRLANVVRQDIAARAKGLKNAINSVWDENTGMNVRDGLNAYRKDVKDYYGYIKKYGTDIVDKTKFRFDFKKLAMKPILDNIGKKVMNPRVQEQFLLFAKRIENASKTRTFSGLIDLRQAVNEFKYGKNELSKPDADALNLVLNKIDAQIARAAKEHMPEAKQWLELFSMAKESYKDMILMEDNAIYKAVTSESATEDSIQRALSKYSSTNDVDTRVYMEVYNRVSAKVKDKMESAAIKNLIEKYTFGTETDLQAVHFPALAEELNKLTIGGSRNEAVVKVVNDMAKVFKNDIDLSGVNVGTSVNKIQSAMSADLLQKAKYTLANKIWNVIVQALPSRSANNAALVSKLSKLLENPLHAKTAEDLLKLIPEQVDIDETATLMKDLQVQETKAGRPKKAKPKGSVKKGKVKKSMLQRYIEDEQGSIPPKVLENDFGSLEDEALETVLSKYKELSIDETDISKEDLRNFISKGIKFINSEEGQEEIASLIGDEYKAKNVRIVIEDILSKTHVTDGIIDSDAEIIKNASQGLFSLSIEQLLAKMMTKEWTKDEESILRYFLKSRGYIGIKDINTGDIFKLAEKSETVLYKSSLKSPLAIEDKTFSTKIKSREEQDLENFKKLAKNKSNVEGMLQYYLKTKNVSTSEERYTFLTTMLENYTIKDDLYNSIQAELNKLNN